MNALYHADAVRLLLNEGKAQGVPLLFVTNNVCNAMLKFEDASGVIEVRAGPGCPGGYPMRSLLKLEA